MSGPAASMPADEVGGPRGADCCADFCVIIVHRNGAELLLRTLGAVTEAFDPAHHTVFVVDNGSRDDSLARVRAAYPSIEIIENGCNRGYAEAINQVIPQCRSDFVLILNNDTLVPPHIFDRFGSLFAANPDAAVIGPLLVAQDGTPQRSFGLEPTIAGEVGLWRSERRRPPLPPISLAPVDWVSGACMAVRRRAINEAGSIDSDFFFYCEDMEWCIRLRRAGWQVLLDQETRVVHEMGTSTRPVYRGAQLEALRSRLLLYRKIYSPGAATFLIIWRLGRLLVNAAAHALLVAATIGLADGIRDKFVTYCYQIAWILAGRPECWGLPEKCTTHPP